MDGADQQPLFARDEMDAVMGVMKKRVPYVVRWNFHLYIVEVMIEEFIFKGCPAPVYNDQRSHEIHRQTLTSW